MEKTLALDLGSNSIGWTIRDISDGTEQFKKSGVITFNKGVGSEKNVEYSFAAQRTRFRSIRRLYQARKYKLWETLDLLRKNGYCPITEEELNQWRWYKKDEGYFRKYPVDAIKFEQWIKLDFNGDNIPDYTSPYHLRAILITEKLDFNLPENKYKLGRALYHIAQHRAFKSSKKVNLKEDVDVDETSIGGENKKQKELLKKLAEIGITEITTIGETFYRAEKIFKEKKEGRIRNNLHTSVTRKELQNEVKKIFEFQGLNFSDLFGKDKNGNEKKISQSAIFWQRPLRSQKGTVGKCTLEPNKYRCPESHPAFEEFRALSFLNNIQFKDKNVEEAEWEKLPAILKNKIYKEKFFRTSISHFDFFEIANLIKKENQHDNWILNYKFKTNVSACPVTAKLKQIFGADLENIRIEHKANEKRSVKKTHYTVEDIWHVLFSSDDEDFIEDFAVTKLNLNEENQKRFKALWYSMPVAYGSLSLKAINNILPFLRKGMIYTEATLLAKVPDVLGGKIWKENKEFLIKSISDVIEINRKEKKILNIANNLIAQYKALPNQDKFAEKKDSNYTIKDDDRKKIYLACTESYGEKTWNKLEDIEKKKIGLRVEAEYQSFFKDEKRQFKKLPHLLDSMKMFLDDNFELSEKQLNKLYHPSQIEIYPPSKRNEKDGKIYLQSPKTGAFKNPMAMRALHELRKLVNYLIETNQIEETTRIVVEVARELNDANKRWAYETYQNRRREENNEFADAIRELLKDPDGKGNKVNPDNAEDIDKFRLWYEMIEGKDAETGIEKDKKFIKNEIEIKSKKNKKGEEEGYEVFKENRYDTINKSLYFKLQRAKEDVVAKYRLWKEQNYLCMYTGKMIGITDLFRENVVDFEHTIPRSISFDNSLENLTVCYADYNRNIKKNRFPTQLENYTEDTKYTAIKPRLEKWEQKVKDLELHIEFWKSKSKRATIKDDKDFAIRQKHLWQFELDYWKAKLERFTMEEVKSGFKNSQLVDTQIISKYASHYLKTTFNKVEVQKGSVTAEFRKIFGVQPLDERKDRSKHSHHAKDAMVLTLIPSVAIRENMLKKWYEIEEQNELLKSDTEKNKNAINEKINKLNEELQELKYQCNLPNINKAIDKIDDDILINNIAKDQTLTPANRKIRSRGKVVPIKKDGKAVYLVDKNNNPIQLIKNGKPVFKNDENGKLILDAKGNPIPVLVPNAKWAKGDIIRGELHQQTFYGKINLFKKDENGQFIKNENGDYEHEGEKCVLRVNVDKDLNIDNIVDEHIKRIIEKQCNGRTLDKTIKEDGGIWMLNRNGERIHKIRHIRCYETTVTNPISIKAQTYKSDKEYKNYYWAKTGKNYLCVLFQNFKKDKKGKIVKDKNGKEQIEREIEILDLMKVRELRSINLENGNYELNLFRTDKTGKEIIDSDRNKQAPFAIFKQGMKVIFFDNNIEELKELQKSSPSELNKRIYKIKKFADSRITFDYHLEARDDDKLMKVFPEKEFYRLDEKGKELTFGKRGKNGFTENFNDYTKYNNGKPWHRLLYSKDYLNFAIENIDFIIKPDGKIIFK